VTSEWQVLDTLDKLMTVDEALERWPGRFTREELMRSCREGKLHHISKGRKRLVTEQWLVDYMSTMEVKACAGKRGERKGDSNSEGTGSAGSEDGPTGFATGMTSEEEGLAADLLARKITRKPKGG
jgi:hypothetical protein